jgi:arabinofuranosyltransferase
VTAQRIRYLLVAVITAIVLALAWISDDALITVRMALNLANGHGAVYNIGEKVQAYTHPLWFVLLYIGGRMTGQWMVWPMALGILCSLGTMLVIARRGASNAQVIVALIALLASNAFLEYSTSGLENSLTFLLITTLIACAVSVQRESRWTLLAISGVISSVAMVNRLDTAILVLPICVAIAWSSGINKKVVALFVGGALPLVVWAGLTVPYYGALLPNTFVAKTNVHIAHRQLITQGLRYFGNAWKFDPMGMSCLFVLMVVLLMFGSLVSRAVVAGACTYMAYVVWVGGDFMAGRFFSTVIVVVVAAFALDQNIRMVSFVDALISKKTAVALVGAIVLCVSVGWSDVAHLPARVSSANQVRWAFSANHGISDERGNFMTYRQGLWQYVSDGVHAPSQTPDQRIPVDNAHAPLSVLQWVATHWNQQPVTPKIGTKRVEVVCGLLGRIGLYTGPTVHWIDPCGLTDRLTASIAFNPRTDKRWRIGHFVRRLPRDYVTAVATGDASYIKNPAMRAKLLKIWKLIHR